MGSQRRYLLVYYGTDEHDIGVLDTAARTVWWPSDELCDESPWWCDVDMAHRDGDGWGHEHEAWTRDSEGRLVLTRVPLVVVAEADWTAWVALWVAQLFRIMREAP